MKQNLGFVCKGLVSGIWKAFRFLLRETLLAWDVGHCVIVSSVSKASQLHRIHRANKRVKPLALNYSTTMVNIQNKVLGNEWGENRQWCLKKLERGSAVLAQDQSSVPTTQLRCTIACDSSSNKSDGLFWTLREHVLSGACAHVHVLPNTHICIIKIISEF